MKSKAPAYTKSKRKQGRKMKKLLEKRKEITKILSEYRYLMIVIFVMIIAIGAIALKNLDWYLLAPADLLKTVKVMLNVF